MKKKLLPHVMSAKAMLILGSIGIILLLVNTIFTVWTYMDVYSYDEVTASLYSYDYDTDIIEVEYEYNSNYYYDIVFMFDEGAYEINGYVNPLKPNNFICLDDLIVGTIIIYAIIMIYVIISSVFIFKALFSYYLPKRLKQFAADRKLAQITQIVMISANTFIINAMRDGKIYKSVKLKGDTYYWKNCIKEYTYNVPIYIFMNKYYLDFEELKPSIDNF